jgi:hypothetical protein
MLPRRERRAPFLAARRANFNRETRRQSAKIKRVERLFTLKGGRQLV